LINPPADFLINQKVFVTLGILRVASFLEQNGYEVAFLDLADVENWKTKIKSLDGLFDYIGMTATTPQIPIVTEIIQYIKKFKNNVKTIIGGPHVTIIYYASIKELNHNNVLGRASIELNRLQNLFDVLICGDGELAINEVIKKDLTGIVDVEKSKDLFLTNDKYNSLPFPARHLIDMDSYNYTIDGYKATNLICQMGCPFECGFCGGRYCKTYRSIRTRSTSSVIKEIDFLYKNYGYQGFMFYDDELNINGNKFVDFLQELEKYQVDNHIDFKFRGFTIADLLTQEQANLMYKVGFRWILTGFESGSDRILLNMNKKNTVDDNTRCFNIAKSSGLKVKALMSIGHPGESIETIKETKNWLQLVKPDEIDFTIISTYPGTPYYDESVWNEDKQAWMYVSKNGDSLYSLNVNYLKDSVFYKSKSGEYKAFVFTDYLSCQDLINERLKLEKDLKCLN
jgi:radical SAM superfamily enzyme YgiQ (UPF0313 family)